jgi:signal transduction histidine kinase
VSDDGHVKIAARILLGLVAGLGGAGLLFAITQETADSDWTTGDVIWIGVAVVPLYAVGVFIAYRRPEHPQARRLLLAGSTLATGVGLESLAVEVYRDHSPGQWFWLFNLAYGYTNIVGLIAGTSLIALFPFGVAERVWIHRVVQSLWALLALPLLLLITNHDVVINNWLPVPKVSLDSPLTVSWLTWLGPSLDWLYQTDALGYVGPLLLMWRYHRARREERVIMRGLFGVLSLAMTLLFLVVAVGELGLAGSGVTEGVTGVVSVLVLATLSLIIVVGILRYRLFDIDVVLRRPAVFAVLWLAIAAIYVAVAAAPGLALGGRIPVQVAVLLTMVVAVVFQPLRRRVEALADRWVFGKRVNRYQLVRSFGAVLEMSIDLGDLLPRLATTVRDGLGAPWVRIRLRSEDAQDWLVDSQATAGVRSGSPELTQELRRGEDVIGRIECGAKPGGYDTDDRELLATLTGQAATAISNVRLAAQLAERLAELERSRARIITAEDAERRRIERDLHDGAQQEVVAILTKLGMARNQLARGDSPAALLTELQEDALELLAELRELAQGIHPPVLSDKGLVAAVEARADRLTLPVTVRADEALRARRLDNDIEGAAYYLICEALTNVVKHSGATQSEVALSSADDCLRIDVNDDGAGLRRLNGDGMGLTNIRDRVEALGGHLEIDSRPGVGTRLRAELPVPRLGAT